MDLRPEEITAVIEKQLESYEKNLQMEDVGTILTIGDSIATVYGLNDAMIGELLEFPNKVTGMVLNLEEHSVGVALFDSEVGIKEGDIVKRTNTIASIPVGDGLIGRVINPIGEPLDGKGPIACTERRPIEFMAPGVISRQSVKEPLMTGLKAIDSMVPIGRGQRELIIGDRQTGKTAIAIDTIINQRDSNVFCIYVAICQKASSVAAVVDKLQQYDAMKYSVVILADANDSATMQYIAPYAGAAIGEHYMYSGRHALCVYDDLSKHAVAYRQLALLLRRPPGREAYPGDIFYCHSRLLERAAKLKVELGGGSLTAFPIIETQAGDLSSYIPTNVISITDGQIFLDHDLFNAGIRPAIDVGLSVSRVGGSAQSEAMKKCGGKLRIELAQYREVAAFAKFGSDLDKATIAQIKRGERVMEILKQNQYESLDLSHQIIFIFSATQGFVDDVEIDRLEGFEKGLVDYISKAHPVIYEKIEKDRCFSREIQEELTLAINEFKVIFHEQENHKEV